MECGAKSLKFMEFQYTKHSNQFGHIWGGITMKMCLCVVVVVMLDGNLLEVEETR